MVWKKAPMQKKSKLILFIKFRIFFNLSDGKQPTTIWEFKIAYKKS